MKVKAGQLYEAKPSLDKILDLPLSLRKAHQLSKDLKKLHDDFIFVEEKRNNIIKENCEPDPENPNNYKIVPEKSDALQEAMKELLELEIDVDIEEIDLTGVDLDSSEVKFTVKEALALEPFVKF